MKYKNTADQLTLLMEIGIFLIVLAGLLAGLALKQIFIPDFNTYNEKDLLFEYPSDWIRDLSLSVRSSESTLPEYSQSVSFRSMKKYDGSSARIEVKLFDTENFNNIDNILVGTDLLSNMYMNYQKKKNPQWKLISSVNSENQSMKQFEYVFVETNRKGVPEVKKGKDFYMELSDKIYRISIVVNGSYTDEINRIIGKILTSIEGNGGVNHE